jgi:hypothetical protein
MPNLDVRICQGRRTILQNDQRESRGENVVLWWIQLAPPTYHYRQIARFDNTKFDNARHDCISALHVGCDKLKTENSMRLKSGNKNKSRNENKGEQKVKTEKTKQNKK